MRSVRATLDDRGFTLVEMLVALAMVALAFAALSYSIRPGASQARPRDVARMIAAEARAASIKAVASGRNSVLRVDLTKRVVSLDDGPAKVKIPAAYAVSMKAAEQLVRGGNVGNIEFFPDGSSTGGEISVASSSADAYVVRIFWLTGEITTRQTQ